MQITIVNDADGCPRVSLVDDSGTVTQAAEVGREHSVTVTVNGEATVTLGEITANAEPEAEEPAAGEEPPAEA